MTFVQHMQSHKYHHNEDIIPKSSHILFCGLFQTLTPIPWQLLIWLLFLQYWLFRMSNNITSGAWLLSFNIIYLRFIHVSVSIICSLLLLNSISLYSCTRCLYLCTSWWTLGLFSPFDNYKLCWYRHLHKGLCAEIRIFLFICKDSIHRSGIFASCDKCMFNYSKLPICFPKQLYYFLIPTSMHESSFQLFCILYNIWYGQFVYFYFSHCNRYVVWYLTIIFHVPNG